MMKKTIRTMSAIGVLAAELATFVTPLHAEPQKLSEKPDTCTRIYSKEHNDRRIGTG